MVTVRFEVFGDTQVDRSLQRLGDAALDFRPAGDDLMQLMQDIERDQFDTEGRSGSGGWKPLKASTIRQKARHLHAEGVVRILQNTERLVKSLTDKDADDAVREVNAGSFVYASTVPYAKYHQTGAPRANVPQRRPVELTETNRRDMVKILQAHLMGER